MDGPKSIEIAPRPCQHSVRRRNQLFRYEKPECKAAPVVEIQLISARPAWSLRLRPICEHVLSPEAAMSTYSPGGNRPPISQVSGMLTRHSQQLCDLIRGQHRLVHVRDISR